ncbi:MAG: tripartite tricarboxylate transporter permease [Chloroflexi bacterium]|nr:tripartite tricarboxylate transporter permease [Chloroflexota bacterium]
MDYFDALAQGLVALMDPTRFLFLFLGVLLGIAVGVLPGLGGTATMAILLPVIYGMDPYTALALLIGMMAVTATADTIPAVLFAVPGSTSAATSIIEGYPMAKQGQAARALGAAFSASMLGGLFGAVVLVLSVPIARPLLQQWLSPEFFMLCLTGVVLVGGLAGDQPLKGLMAGGLGLLLATIGGAPGVGFYRFTFDLPYLLTGIPLIIVALGMFGLPELVDMQMKGTSVSEVPIVGKGVWQGYKDTFRNWWLVIRSSAIGAWVGFAPGIGQSAASWIAYSHAVTTTKDGKFGKGDVRGLIAPEAANNAVRGGDLIPTLLFGIPGSGGMAVFLVALILIGVRPGPDMVDKQLPFLFTVVWSLAIASIIVTAMCTALIRPIAALSTVKAHIIIPFILLFVMVGAFQATGDWGDWIALAVFGVLGWTMKRVGYPRPPLMVGFVLGSLAERYLWTSVAIWDGNWLYRPWVLGLFAVIIASLVFVVRKPKQQQEQNEPAQISGGV